MGLPFGGSLALRSAVSFLDKFEIQALPGATIYDFAGTIGTSVESNAGVAHPEFKAITSLTYSRDVGSFGITWRYIDSMKHSGFVTAPATAPPGIKAYNVFDINARYSLPWDSDVRIGITNLFNKAPPSYSATPETYDSSSYDVVGRYFFMSLTKKF
jgi:outer membrane receptor protein involved in Fe transport